MSLKFFVPLVKAHEVRSLTEDIRNKFMELLGSGDKAEADNIIQYVKEYPELTNERYGKSKDTLLHIAVLFDKGGLVKRLCNLSKIKKLGFILNERGQTLFHFASRNKNAALIIPFLIKEFPSIINTQDHVGETALHQAVISERVTVVSLFVQAGADISLLNRDGLSPLALCNGNLDIKNALLQINLSQMWNSNSREIVFKVREPNLDYQHRVSRMFPELFSRRSGAVVNKIPVENKKYHEIVHKSDLFDSILRKTGLMQASTQLDDSLITTDTEILRRLCFSFDSKRTSNQVLALSQTMTYQSIVSTLSSLLQEFSTYQQLVTMFILKTWLLRYDLPLDKADDENLLEVLEVFFKQASLWLFHERRSEKMQGGLLEALLRDILAIKRAPGLFLDKSKGKEEEVEVEAEVEVEEVLNPEMRMFSRCVKDAIHLSGHARKDLIKIIANEIRMLSISFYQKVEASDFVDKASFIILLHTKQYRMIIMYFSAMLFEDPQNIAKGLEFIIELIQELCTVSEHLGPDLMGACTIMGVFQLAPVSRLPIKDMIDKTHRAAFKNISNLFSLDANHGKSMREVFIGYEKCILFPGILINDFERSCENKLMDALEVKGRILSDLLIVKETCKNINVCFLTDIENFLEQFTPISEDDLFYASYRVKLRLFDTLDLNKDLEKQLLVLQEDYLEHRFLPRIKVSNQLYEPCDILEGLGAFCLNDASEVRGLLDAVINKAKDVLYKEYSMRAKLEGFFEHKDPSKDYINPLLSSGSSSSFAQLRLSEGPRPSSDSLLEMVSRNKAGTGKGSKVKPTISWGK